MRNPRGNKSALHQIKNLRILWGMGDITLQVFNKSIKKSSNIKENEIHESNDLNISAPA